MSKIFYITSEESLRLGGPKRYICVVIHPDEDQFARVMMKKAPHQDGWKNSVGGFHPMPHQEVYNKKRKKWETNWKNCYAGDMHLIQSHLTVEIIAHESAHATSHICRSNRIDEGYELSLGVDCGDEEETFCYILGEITQKVYFGITDLYELSIT